MNIDTRARFYATVDNVLDVLGGGLTLRESNLLTALESFVEKEVQQAFQDVSIGECSRHDQQPFLYGECQGCEKEYVAAQ